MLTGAFLLSSFSMAIAHPFDNSLFQSGESLLQQKLFGIRLPWFRHDRTPAPEDRRRGGATRDQCPPTGDRLVTALVPSDKPDLPNEYNPTISSRPELLFYIPFTADQARTVEFVMINENEEELYRGRVPLINTPGIIRIQLPDGFALEEDQSYRWVFSVICNPENRSGDITMNGWVRRVRPDNDLEGIESASLRDQAIAYANERLWHETLSALAELRLQNPQDEEVLQAWKELLTNVGLEDIAEEAIAPCCVLQQ